MGPFPGATYTPTISAGGIVTTTESGSYDEGPVNPEISGTVSATETINLLTSAYQFSRNINQNNGPDSRGRISVTNECLAAGLYGGRPPTDGPGTCCSYEV